MAIEIDIKTVLEELKKYVINSWDIHGLFIRAIQKDIIKMYGLYLEEKEIVQLDTIANSVAATLIDIEKKYGTIDNAVLHHKWKGFYNGIRLDSQLPDRETKFYVWEHRLQEFIYMLRYAINGKFDDNLKETHEYMDKNGINYDTDKGTFTIDDMTFIVYKNHKVIVKGMNQEQYARIKHGFDNFKTYMRVG